MPRLRIDGREVEIPAGATILQAAQAAGIDIPTLCYQPGFSPSVSCMVCVVRVTGIARLLPACATLAEEGMEIIADSEEIRQARRINLELILSDHAGDCEGPCRFACPLEPDTPSLLRAWQNLDLAQAQAIASRDLILPATLGFICPAPCEKVCRRREVDAPVAIRLLHQQAGLEALRQASDNRPQPLAVGQSIAVVGAGPAGLAAASRLRDAGFSVTVYDAACRCARARGVCRYRCWRQNARLFCQAG
ncbi:MAG: 2Fe-2S iron-sulfur cluster-binding protein [Planctomycetota bacterium]|nr:2Fe-2S iron-sulfur cluster-binding protein [Planctomycetota bacterium]